MTNRKFKFIAKYVLPTLLLAVLVVGLVGVLPVSAQAGILDHVTVAPATANLAPGATQQFTAQAFDVANNPIAGLSFLWNVAAGGGTISPTGLFTAESSQGTFTNTVQAFAVQGTVIKFGSATVVVTAPAPGPLDHVTISPATATVVAGGTQQFTAQGLDAANILIPGLSFVWNVAAGGGTINPSGLFTAGATTGTFTDTVQAVAVQGAIVKIGTASVTVTAAPGPLGHVTVSPVSATLVVGGTQQFTAQAFDAANVPIPGLGFTWSVINGGGTISAGGLLTAGVTPGSFPNTVQATALQGSITKSGTASVTVTAIPIPVPETEKLEAKKILLLVDVSIRAVGFEHFLGAQWTIKEDGQTMMVKAIPGVVKAISATSITLLPNGQTDNQVFSLASSSRVLAGEHALKESDKAVVVTVDGATRLVIPVPIRGVRDLDKEDRRGPNRGKDDDDDDDDVRDQIKELKDESHDQIKGMRDAFLDRIKELRESLRDQQKELRQGSNRGRG